MNNELPLAHYFQLCRQRVDQALQDLLPEDQLPATLHQAMRYALLEGGKRIRPVLAYATAEAFGAEPLRATPAACAVECIHAYSLVHDDLPAMDDDDLRRGRPTVHRAFDEATAILAGDALQALAFETLTQNNAHLAPEIQLEMVRTLSKAGGSRGMVGGQAIDLGAVGKQLSLAELETMHLFKTGDLIEDSVLLGALSTGVLMQYRVLIGALLAGFTNPEKLVPLSGFARGIGLAFQVQDDILDVESSTENLGNRKGADIARGKPTYPALLGLEGAKQKARQLHDLALTELQSAGILSSRLSQVCDYIIERPF